MGNTTLGDALLQISNDNELVTKGHLDKTARKLKAGTPYDLLFSALLYAPAVILQPTLSKQDASIGFTDGSLSITNLSTKSCLVGTPVTFKISRTNGTISTKSAKVTGMTYGYFTTNSTVNRNPATSVEKVFVVSGSGYSDPGNLTVEVKQGDTTIDCSVDSNGVYTFTPLTDGTYTISATAKDRTHSGGSIESITVYPADSSLTNIASNYATGYTVPGASKSNLGGKDLTVTSQPVTVVAPAYAYCMKNDGTNRSEEVIVDYNGTVPTTVDGANFETSYPADKFPAYVIVPQGKTISKIEVYCWDDFSGSYDDKASEFVFASDGTEVVDGKTYNRYKCNNSSMGGGNYYITIKL